MSLIYDYPVQILIIWFSVLQGKPKKNESWWGIACGVFRMLRKNYGCVRVDFNQPFSLKVMNQKPGPAFTDRTTAIIAIFIPGENVSNIL